MKCGVVVFPGSNCDHDCYHILKHIMGWDTRWVWHKDTELAGLDLLVLPGGFSYGDYLRAGSIACFSPIMKAVADFAGRGGLVLGICNGFQVLTESGLLPGALMRNRSRSFICKFVDVRVETGGTPFTAACDPGEVLSIPIAHADGNYFADEDTLKRLQDNDQIVLKYCDASGNVTEDANPNGSRLNIAGIVNEKRNVMGLMPHPERAADPALPGADGRRLFDSLLALA
ncbi:MAG: phosphoribosylformylglycinamidine synthase subunit PurQ [Nitrospina sp.]|nr:phosphoribosylformylglycinamidine synthase subunit PurQ [Nitrospina sp.]